MGCASSCTSDGHAPRTAYALRARCTRWLTHVAPRHTQQMESPDPALERSFRGHRDRVNAVAFNPNMKQLVTASDDAAVMVWHFRPTLRAFRFIGHKAAVLSVAVSSPEPEP